MKNALAVLSVAALTGCIAVPVIQTTPSRGAELVDSDTAAPICIIVQPDATWDGILYTGSGREVADKVAEVLQAMGRNTVEATMDGDIRESCAAQHAELMLEPQILVYEDFNTGWTGRPDRLELHLVLSHLSEAYVERTAIYRARTNTWMAALVEWNNAKPTELLGKDFEAALKKLLEHR